MKKGFIIVIECICWFVVLIVARIILENIFSVVENNQVISFVLYFLAATGSIVICRVNTKKTDSANSQNKKRKVTLNNKEKGINSSKKMSEEELLLFLTSNML